MKPCPFCGSAPIIYEWRKSEYITQNGTVCPEVWFIGCECLFTKTYVHHGTLDDAIRTWDTRACTSPIAQQPDNQPAVSIDQKAMNIALEKGMYYRSLEDVPIGDILSFLEQYESAKADNQPAVSLEKCARALAQVDESAGAAAWEYYATRPEYKHHIQHLKEQAKAILDAAGVKYVD